MGGQFPKPKLMLGRNCPPRGRWKIVNFYRTREVSRYISSAMYRPLVVLVSTVIILINELVL